MTHNSDGLEVHSLQKCAKRHLRMHFTRSRGPIYRMLAAS